MRPYHAVGEEDPLVQVDHGIRRDAQLQAAGQRDATPSDAAAEPQENGSHAERLKGHLDEIDLLDTLTKHEKTLLSLNLRTEQYGAERPMIVTRGESAECMYFLLEGTASAIRFKRDVEGGRAC